MTPSTKSHGHGLTMGALGMLIISPDGLLLRLIENTDTWTIIFYRSLFLGISLALALLVTYRQQFVRIWLDLGKSGWLSAAILTGTIIGFITAITHTTVANTLIILATMPLFAALLARLILGERISRRTAVSISVACIGILIKIGRAHV